MNSSLKQLKRRDRLRELCFLCPSLLGVSIFFLLPFFVIIYYSLIKGVGAREFVGLGNYIALLQNEAFRLAARNTLVFTALAIPSAVILSLLLAVFMEGHIPGKSRFRSAFLSPMVVPVASVVLIWQVLFNDRGWLNELIISLGGSGTEWLHSAWSPLVIVLLFLWKNLGYNMILFMAGLSNIPTEMLEAARVDGASEARIFFTLKLRYLSPTVLFVTVLSLISSFKIFREVYVLTGDYPYESLYTLQYFMNNTFRSLDNQKLSAAAIVMALVIIMVVALLFWLEDRFSKDI